MESPLIMALITGILSSSVIAAGINIWANRHKPEIERRQLDMQGRKSELEQDLSIAEELRRQNTELKARHEAFESQLVTIQREFDRQIRSLIIRVADLEVAEAENREWIRLAIPLLREHVPLHKQIRPPSWYPTSWGGFGEPDHRDSVE